MYPRHLLRMLISLALLGSLTLGAHAGIRGPYTVDENTLHLYHFDGNANDEVTTNSTTEQWNLTLRNGATVTTSSIAGWGTALSTYAPWVKGVNTYKGASYPTNVKWSKMSGSNGAFTIEALVRPLMPYGAAADSQMPVGQMIVCGDSALTMRSFQFRIHKTASPAIPTGLIFYNLSGSTLQYNPYLSESGSNPYVPNTWYHTAVTYSGTPNVPGNLKIYWTRVEPTRTTADLLLSTTMTSSINPTADVQFCVGNTLRSGNLNSPFLGSIDEVRISSVARTPDQMIFAPIPDISVTPANVTFDNVNVVKTPNAYSTATVTITNTGDGPLTFQTQPDEFKKGIKVTGDNKVTIQSVTPDTATPLAAGQSVKVVLKFAPTATGFVENGDNNHYATLSIFTDAPGKAQLNFPLRGVAVPVELSRFKAE